MKRLGALALGLAALAGCTSLSALPGVSTTAATRCGDA